jgi:hypothetical protein
MVASTDVGSPQVKVREYDVSVTLEEDVLVHELVHEAGCVEVLERVQHLRSIEPGCDEGQAPLVDREPQGQSQRALCVFPPVVGCSRA